MTYQDLVNLYFKLNKLTLMGTLNKSSYVILGLLSKSDYSGYSLKMRMKKTSDFYWSESNAQIYPVLKKLEELKLVSSKIDASSGARNKRIFSITKKGLSELIKWLENDCNCLSVPRRISFTIIIKSTFTK